MLSQEEFDALPIIDDYTPMPSFGGGGNIPTMDIKNSYSGGSFADMYAPAVTRVESNYNPRAVSSAGAQGLMQIMPATGREVAQRLGMSNFDPFDPQQNEIVGKAYLNQMFEQFQDPQLAFAAYNAGPGRVSEVIKRLGTNDPNQVLQYLPEETRNYVPKVLNAYGQNTQIQGQEVDQAPRQEVTPRSSYGALSQEEFDALPIIEDEPATEEAPKPEMGWGEYLRGIGGQSLQGGMFNFADEAGLVDPEFQKRFEEQYPKTAIASQIAGGLAPTAASYLATALSGGAAAPAAAAGTASTVANAGKLAGLLKTGGRVVTGLGPKEAAATGLGRIAQGVGYGSAYGALSGAGAAEGGLTEKATGAAEGGLLGALLGGTVSGGIEGVSRKLPKGRVGKQVNKIVKDVTDSELQAAQAELADAAAKNVPLFLPDAIDQADVTKEVKALMRTKEARTAARRAIDSRADDQLERSTALLDILSPNRDSYAAGSAIQDRSQAVIKAEEQARKETAEELFGAAYKKPPINDVVREAPFNEVMDSEVVQPIIKKLRKFPKYKNLQDDDPRMVQKVLEEFTAIQQSENVGSLADDYSDLKNTVYDTLRKANPELLTARDTYRIDSEKIQALKDLGLGNFANKDQFKVTEFGRQLLDPKTPIEKLKKVAGALGEDGDDLIKSAVRAELQDQIEKAVVSRDITAKFNTTAIRERLSNLMPEADAQKLLKSMDQEVLMAKQNRALTPGSDTADNFDDSKKGIAKALLKLARSPIDSGLGALESLLSRKGIGEDTVKTITTPSLSADVLADILSKREASSKLVTRNQKLGNSLTRSQDPLVNALILYLGQEK